MQCCVCSILNNFVGMTVVFVLQDERRSGDRRELSREAREVRDAEFWTVTSWSRKAHLGQQKQWQNHNGPICVAIVEELKPKIIKC